MQFYPFGIVPTDYPEWYAKPLADAGIDAAHSSTWILSPNPDETRHDSPSAYFLQMPPGYTLFRHGHPCFRFEVIIQGSLEIGDGRVANVGDVFTALPGELYGPHTAGPEGCTTIEFFSRLGAAYTMLYEGEDGEIKEANVLKGEVPPTYVPMPRDLEMMPTITQDMTTE